MLTVGKLRQQTSLADADRPVILVGEDDETRAILNMLEITDTYPDTTDEHGKWTPTFKIHVKRR